jgi:hypothetical protein
MVNTGRQTITLAALTLGAAILATPISPIGPCRPLRLRSPGASSGPPAPTSSAVAIAPRRTLLCLPRWCCRAQPARGRHSGKVTARGASIYWRQLRLYGPVSAPQHSTPDPGFYRQLPVQRRA